MKSSLIFPFYIPVTMPTPHQLGLHKLLRSVTSMHSYSSSSEMDDNCYYVWMLNIKQLFVNANITFGYLITFGYFNVQKYPLNYISIKMKAGMQIPVEFFLKYKAVLFIYCTIKFLFNTMSYFRSWVILVRGLYFFRDTVAAVRVFLQTV